MNTTQETKQLKSSENTGRKHDTRWKKGQSGNPKGKPKGSFSLVSILRRELQKISRDLPKEQRKSYAEALIRKMLHKGIIEGNEQTQKLIMNYVDGMPKQTIETPGLTETLAELVKRLNEQ